VPLAAVLVPLSGVIGVAGGLSLATGYQSQWGAALIALFLIMVSVMMNRFWGLSDPEAAKMQFIMVMKNISMIGAALIFTQIAIR
jgi:uncharacterized membrane protein YphA (DoxX/SURF4 family)